MFILVKEFQTYKNAKLVIKNSARHFGSEATFYIVVHGRILAKIIKPKLGKIGHPQFRSPLTKMNN